MAQWIPRLVFSSVNKTLAWRLLVPMLLVTGISGAGAKEQALPNLWKEIVPAIEKNL
jgi:O-antigen ligase